MRRLLIVLFILFAAVAYGQWPSSADTNLVICDRAGEQTLPKIAVCACGTYISWYDHSSGNYDLYMQRLDVNGVPQWTANGLLISSHPQETSLTDYDLTVDSAGCAILVFNDIRAGSDRDIYAYRISPAGEFLWGPDGIALSNNGNFEADPRVCVLPDGSHYAFAWVEDTDSGNVVHVNARDINGASMFTDVILSSQYGCTVPRIAAAPHDWEVFYVQYLVAQGSQIGSPRHIYMRRYTMQGQFTWNNPVAIMTTNGIGIQMKPELICDLNEGVISYWYDTRDNNRHHVYIQRIAPEGFLAFAQNGLQVVTTANQLQMNPMLVLNPYSWYGSYYNSMLIFYMTSDLNQTTWGIGAQLLDSLGPRAWSNDGRTLVAQSAQQRFGLLAFSQYYGATLVYLESQGGLNTHVKAMGVRADSGMQWENSPRTLCSVNSSKLHLVAAKNARNQVVAVWGDGRATGGDDIYLQDINANGALGAYVPPTITITSPQDSTDMGCVLMPITFEVQNFTFGWPRGDGLIEAQIRNRGGTHSKYLSTTTPYQNYNRWFDARDYNAIILELVQLDGRWLSPRVADSVHVIATGAADDLPSGLPKKFALSPAFPNPFNPATEIAYDLPHEQRVSLRVFDLLGREVAELINGLQTAGTHRVSFDGRHLPSGVYLYRLQAGTESLTKKMMLLK